MATLVEIVGKADVGLMVNGPLPGILNWMTLMPPAAALAVVIASRSVHSAALQTPSPGSAVEFTTSGGGSSEKQVENSELLPLGSVAVAVIFVPGGSGSLVA